MSIDIENPFIKRFRKGGPGCTPESSYAAFQAIEQAVVALADSGQVRVWTLENVNDKCVGSIHATLAGAVQGAVNIMADELISGPSFQRDLERLILDTEAAMETPKGRKELADKATYHAYMCREIKWEISYETELEIGNNFSLGGYVVETTYGDEAQQWIIQWYEVIP